MPLVEGNVWPNVPTMVPSKRDDSMVRLAVGHVGIHLQLFSEGFVGRYAVVLRRAAC